MFLFHFNVASKAMKKFCGGVLTVVMMGHLLQELSGQCQSSGFSGCEFNIMKACDAQGNPRPNLDNKLTGYSPSGLEQFGSFVGKKQNLAYLCENGAIAILYDCENRTPVYSATVIDEQQLNAQYARPSIKFKQSSSLNRHYQQKDSDYKGSSKTVEICNKKKAKKRGVSPLQKCPQISENNDELYAPIHKGHLIAAAYGRGNEARIAATFTYTNTVPQFGHMNTGIWRAKEQALVKWGRENCANHNGGMTESVRMHIIVGVIPSTFHQSDQPRFFGAGGFSDDKGEDAPINVPSRMWTAACCTFQFKDDKGNDKQGTRHTFFAVENTPEAADELPKDYVSYFQKYTSQNIVLFPAQPDCNSEANYLQL